MNKQIITMLLALGLTACGSGKQQENVQQEGSENTTTEAVATTTETESADFALTDKGVGPIVLGMNVAEIPQSVNGLYDRVEKVETPDAEEYHFYQGDVALFSAEDAGDSVVSAISLFNESPIPVKTSNGENYISQ